MRVAFVGKGGAGKSAVAGTFARLLARRGEPVLAIDSDPLPGLAFSLGLDVTDAAIPDDAVVERAEGETGPRFRLRPDLAPEQAVELYAVQGPDGVRFLQFGKQRGSARALARAQMAFREIVRGLTDARWNLVGDLPGGIRQAAFGWGDYAETFIVVAEPTAKSTLSARRIARLLTAKDGSHRVVAVVNKAASPADAELVQDRTGLEVVGLVPFDEQLREAERSGRAVIDAAPGSPVVEAVESALERLTKEHSA